MISVIVPIVGDTKYLKRCISSLEQQGDAVEIICVISTAEDEDKPPLKATESINVVTTSNTAYSHLCAAGLEQAQSEWVSFIRVCDRWSPHFVENCMRGLSSADTDIVVTEAFEFGDSNQRTSLSVRDVQAASNCTRFLFNLFDQGDIPWNKLYRREILDASDLKQKPLTETATGHLIELTAFARARNALLATRADYQVMVDLNRIGDKLTAEEEFPQVIAGIDALDIAAGVWQQCGILEGRETEYLEQTQILIDRAYNFGRKHFHKIARRFYDYRVNYFTRKQIKAINNKTKRLFCNALDVVGSYKSVYIPGSFFALLHYTTHLNLSVYFKSPGEVKQEFREKHGGK